MRTLKEPTVAARPGAKLEASPEVKGLMTKFYEAASAGKFELLDEMVSRRVGLLWIGTDAEEWWESPEAVLQAWREQTRQLGGPAPITAGKTVAYRQGDVAWVSDRPAFHLPDGKALPFRFTAVWLREPEGWKIVQVHFSLAVPNKDVVSPG